MAFYESSRTDVNVVGINWLHSIFEDIIFLATSYQYITLQPKRHGVGCRINTRILLKIAKVAFEVSDHGSLKSPIFRASQVILAISGELEKGTPGEFISLTACQDDIEPMTLLQVRFLHSIFPYDSKTFPESLHFLRRCRT